DIEFLHATAPSPQSQTGDRLPSLAEAERSHIVRVLEAVEWNKKEAARVLDISRGTLYRKIVEYSLEPEPRAAGARRTAARAPEGAWSQCTSRMNTRTPPYRTLYSMASLVLTVKAAGVVYMALGGTAPGEPFSLWTVPKPLVGSATTYFVCNTAFIATAIGLS